MRRLSGYKDTDLEGAPSFPNQIATGVWNKSSYSPPNRVWTYESSYQTGVLPPFTPFTVEMQKGAWWQG